MYNKEFLKSKIKFHGHEFTDFFDNEIPKVDSDHTCMAVISLDSALKRNENCYPQLFLKECKYTEKKVVRHIHDTLSSFPYFFLMNLTENKLECVNFFCKSIAT